MCHPERFARPLASPFRPTPCGCWLGIIAAVLTAAATAFSQPASGRSQYEITSIAFDGNASLTKSELLAQMTTKETPGFLNKFLYDVISEKLGRKREYLNTMILGTDLKRLRRHYENRGFSEASVDTALAYDDNSGTVNVTIKIREGYRSLIDSLTYGGIINAPGTIWTEILASPKIAPGDPFDSQLLEEEVGRVMKILANTGYPNALFLRDSSGAWRFASSRNYKVKLAFNLGKMYYFGNVTIRQEYDTLRSSTRRDDITDDIIIQQLTYAPGKHYSVEDSLTSANNLNRLGIFDLRRMDMKIPPRQDTAVTVPTSILLRPKDKHELGPELIVSDENGALNLGGGASYMNRNFLGGARIFTTALRFRTQTLRAFPHYFDKNSDAVSNLDLTFELAQPYVFSNRIRGSWAFSFIVDKQVPYLQNIVRNKFDFINRFTEYTSGFFDWTLESVASQKNDNFTGDPNDPEIQRQIKLLQQESFNSIFSFTIQRDLSNDIFTPSAGSIQSATFDDGGMFPLLLQGLFPNLPITQFYRFSLTGRWYTEVTPHRFSILAFKLKGGIEDKYGEARADPDKGIPQTHRFYAGGSNSVRGWNSRDLIASGDPQLGGNLSLETSVEMRVNVLQSLRDGLFDKIWVVQFLDIGNVWGQLHDFRFNTFAIATGLGLRYDTFFGPFRIDWGIRVFNPGEPAGHQWITQRQLIAQTFKEGVFHFGIGHAF